MSNFVRLPALLATCAALVGVACGTDTTQSGSGGSDTDAGADASGSAGPITVGGTVSGLAGTGLVLQNNEGDDLAVNANGAFVFTKPVPTGSGYAVTVKTQPKGPPQTCTVDGGSGTAGGADVTNVAVVCKTDAFTIGGTVSGLAPGNSVVLQDNGGDDLTVSADGTFAFKTRIAAGAAFAVTVLTQPTTPNQTCVVTGDKGSVVAGNVTSVAVNCTTNQYTAGGTVSGLAGSGLVLQNNGGGDLPINANGGFAFPPQDDGSAYAITVKSQPTTPSQTCTVTGGTGNLAGANATGVTVSCVTNEYTVGGTITGLTGTLVLTNEGADDLTLTTNDPFTFATPIESGTDYAVAVKTQPAGQHCTVASGSGTVTTQNVTDVAVTCVACTLGTTTFDFTGAEQTLTVPICAVTATITVQGAQGGDAPIGGTGGLGGKAQGDLTVKGGDVLHVFVGGTNGYNGGGAGGQNGNTTFGGQPGTLAPSGGGASDVRLNGATLADRVIVAGGGGGAAANGDWPACQVAGPAGNGGAGGALTGGAGTAGVSSPCNCGGGGGAGGQGGTQAAGGAHGAYAGSTACLRGDWTAGGDGSLGQGGDGATTYHNGTGGAGGGGGGYYGGGAGGNGSDTTAGGGGGGGSSYVGALANASTTAGVRSGDGTVSITFK